MSAKTKLAVILAAITLTGVPALAACGDRSGPGYRGPNGKCVGWAELGRICGSPPTTRCNAENVADGTETASGHGKKVEDLRSNSRKK